MIPVFNENNEVVARVESNQNLDYWDGNNMTCGSTGRHKGLTRLKKTKEFVLIRTTQWQGERDSAEIISKDQAFQEIAKSGSDDLMKRYFPDKVKGDEEE